MKWTHAKNYPFHFSTFPEGHRKIHITLCRHSTRKSVLEGKRKFTGVEKASTVVFLSFRLRHHSLKRKKNSAFPQIVTSFVVNGRENSNCLNKKGSFNNLCVKITSNDASKFSSMTNEEYQTTSGAFSK